MLNPTVGVRRMMMRLLSDPERPLSDRATSARRQSVAFAASLHARLGRRVRSLTVSTPLRHDAGAHRVRRIQALVVRSGRIARGVVADGPDPLPGRPARPPRARPVPRRRGRLARPSRLRPELRPERESGRRRDRQHRRVRRRLGPLHDRRPRERRQRRRRRHRSGRPGRRRPGYERRRPDRSTGPVPAGRHAGHAGRGRHDRRRRQRPPEELQGEVGRHAHGHRPPLRRQHDEHLVGEPAHLEGRAAHRPDARHPAGQRRRRHGRGR